MENKEEITEFSEEIIISDKPILKNQPRKLNSKIIGKKTILRKGLKSKPPLEKSPPKKSNAESLIDTIVKTYWTSKWKEQITIKKFSRVGYNKKRGDFRTLCMKLNHSMKYHQYLYLAKLFDNMEKLPVKPNIKHDDFYGKVKLVSKNDNKIKNYEKTEIKDDENIIFDKVEIKIDIPKVVEVENNPDKIKEKEEQKDNIIIEDKKEIENESIPKLKTKEKKIIKRKKIENNENDNLDNKNIENDNKEKDIPNDNNNIKFIDALKDVIEKIIKRGSCEKKSSANNEINFEQENDKKEKNLDQNTKNEDVEPINNKETMIENEDVFSNKDEKQTETITKKEGKSLSKRIKLIKENYLKKNEIKEDKK